MTPQSDTSTSQQKSPLERFLTIFTEVLPGEGPTALLLTLNLFLLLTAYLIIKTVREPLILAEGGAEVKSYAAAGQALLLLFIVPTYGSLASKVNRVKLINFVTIFFISNLIAFYILGGMQVPLGVPFFLWVGIFNLFIIAQFWSFANDLYTEEQGKRLFVIIAFGGGLGAIVGPALAGWLFKSLGPYGLMLISASVLAVCMGITKVINAREQRRARATETKGDGEKPLGREGGFKLVMKQRYLLWIALLMLVLNVINTTGEFIMGKTVTAEAQKVVAVEEERAAASGNTNGFTPEERKRREQEYIGSFYGNFFSGVSVLSTLIQLFLVSRIIKFVGVMGALVFLPMIALSGYSLIAFMPVLAVIRVMKTLENSTDYSLQNTARQALFLPTSREAKYKAKSAIDTFFVRIGDMLSAGIVFTGVQYALDTTGFAMINVVLVVVWLLLIAGIAREYKKLVPAEAVEEQGNAAR